MTSGLRVFATFAALCCDLYVELIDVAALLDGLHREIWLFDNVAASLDQQLAGVNRLVRRVLDILLAFLLDQSLRAAFLLLEVAALLLRQWL